MDDSKNAPSKITEQEAYYRGYSEGSKDVLKRIFFYVEDLLLKTIKENKGKTCE